MERRATAGHFALAIEEERASAPPASEWRVHALRPLPSVAPIALQADEGEALWFLGLLVFVKASNESTDGRVAAIEHLGPRGADSPLHVHTREDEWFYVTEGELTFWIGGELIEGPLRDLPELRLYFEIGSSR